MGLKCLEPGRVFGFSFRQRSLEIDLRYEALMKPLVTRGEPPFNHGSHIDQPGRVTGTMTLRGEVIPVNCLSMRDRSWGIRRDGRQPKVGYSYATASEHSAVLSISVTNRADQDLITTGFLMRDGEWSRLAGGTREVERDASGRPARITISGIDELGRTVELSVPWPVGRCSSATRACSVGTAWSNGNLMAAPAGEKTRISGTPKSGAYALDHRAH